LLYKYTTMLFKTSQNQKKIRESLIEISGDSYNLFEKINLGFYGSPKDLVQSMTPQTFDLNFEDYTDLVYCTIELRKKGVGIYFRFKNEEYILISRHNQISFLNNDGIFEIQANNYIVKLKVTDSNSHKKFMRKYIESRNLSM
jgi:hypothetical protein